MATANFVFENPKGSPLGELYFEIKDNGIKTKIPALNKYWIVPRAHTKYIPLPLLNDGKLSDNLNEWITEATWFNKEVEWLLGLEHFRFWSHLIYDAGYLTSLISFLQESTPSYISLSSIINENNGLHQSAIELYTNILKNVLKILCRMVTNKESDTEWITNEHLSELLYKHYLITIPMIFDILIAYGKSNEIILKRLIRTIFDIEPKYLDDLKTALIHIENALKKIKEQIDDNNNENMYFDDLALYTLDVATTIYLLLNIYPKANDICLAIKFEQTLTNFYEIAIPSLYTNIFMINNCSKSLNYLNNARMALLHSFRFIIDFCIERILLNPSKSLPLIESLMEMFQEALVDKSFVIDYQRLYPIRIDMDRLKKSCKMLEKFDVNFIIEAYSSDEYDVIKNFTNQLSDDEDSNLEIPSPIENNENTVIANDIKTVLDVLPHLEIEFVRKLLSRYDTTELAIAAILEGNLPPDLEPKEDHNANSNDNDNNDNSNNDNNNTKIDSIQSLLNDFGLGNNVIIKTGKGFPGHPRNMTALLNDKSHVNELRSRYQQYGTYEDVDEYDDEYDDSYDALADSETKAMKSLKNSTARNVVMDDVDDDTEDGDDDDDDDDENDEIGNGAKRDKSNDFCENPEIVRERYARARQHKYAASAVKKPSSNVVGKPKGQGQDASTVTSRHKKDVNKSTRANHNRRTGAAFKRNKGMIPS